MINLLRFIKKDDGSNGFPRLRDIGGSFITAPNIKFLFDNYESIVAQIKKDELEDVHYMQGTVNFSGAVRKTTFQEIVAFDLDGVDLKFIDIYSTVVASTLGIDLSKTTVIKSGRGIHYIILLDKPLNTDDMQRYKYHYNLLCRKINVALANKNLPVDRCDPNVFRNACSLRMPGTINPKNGAVCQFHTRNLEPQAFTLKEKFEKKEGGETNRIKVTGPVDGPAILEGCVFLNWLKENQETAHYDLWFAGLTILSRLENGRDLCHDYSRNHPKYNFDETECKIDEARELNGGYSCAGVGELFDCSSCPHYKKISSPFKITSKGFIATSESNFHKVDGKKVPEVVISDLVKYFAQEYEYFVGRQSKILYIYKDNHWKIWDKDELARFAQKSFNELSNIKKCDEFIRWVYRTNPKEDSFFGSQRQGMFNARNCIVNLKTGERIAHSPDYGFTTISDFDYDPDAQAPRAEQFFEEVFLGDQELIQITKEFGGYIIGDSTCKHEKALMCHGDGRNGKSVLLDIYEYVVGEPNRTSVNLEELKIDNYRIKLVGKMLNKSDETPKKALLDSTQFKKAVSGDAMSVKLLYSNAGEARNTAKFVISTNELPNTDDFSHGLTRRFIILPFNRTFTDKDDDKGLRAKLFEERSGIFNMFMEGYQHLEAQGYFSGSKKAAAELEAFKQDSDAVLGFFTDHIVLKSLIDCNFEFDNTNKNFYYDGDYIYTKFIEYCKENHKGLMSKNRFRRRFHRLLNHTEKMPRYQRWGKGNCYAYFNLDLLEEDRDTVINPKDSHIRVKLYN